MPTLELSEEITLLYAPSARHVDLVEVPEYNFIMLDGEMEAGTTRPSTSEAFQEALNTLNGISFTLKFMSKLNRKNPLDYNTMPLEALWYPPKKSDYKDRENWKWTMMMMQPEHITAEMFESAVGSLKKKQGEIPTLTLARFEAFNEGTSVQIMHVSSFGLIPMTIERIKAFAKDQNHTLAQPYHEVYISDPRHENPEKERTILRYPLKK
ncbi:MAG: hypothetical protein HN392_11055 [Anaerolineae bacterium]|jgi:hypothetical protein|nr:hypothetical protein [Anaerolineae bacterium]MBT7075231.1 hypothetical protein [Anaerolineae bacterium]MBT7781844.1 hypothetical protein [Anaerolineae bacterium]